MFPRLGVLQIPVTFYAFTLCTTGFLGVLTAIEKGIKSALFLALGCMLFVISDSMIAFDAFYFSEKNLWAMGHGNLHSCTISYRYFFSQKVVYLNGVYCGMCINIFNSNNWPPLCNDLTFRHQTKTFKNLPNVNE